MTPSNRCGAKIVLAKLLDACSVAASPTTGEVQSMKPTQLGVAKQPAIFLVGKKEAISINSNEKIV